jgi:hypothetical protein
MLIQSWMNRNALSLLTHHHLVHVYVRLRVDWLIWILGLILSALVWWIAVHYNRIIEKDYQQGTKYYYRQNNYCIIFYQKLWLEGRLTTNLGWAKLWLRRSPSTQSLKTSKGIFKYSLTPQMKASSAKQSWRFDLPPQWRIVHLYKR